MSLLEGRVYPCGPVELNKPQLPPSCMEISMCLLNSPALFVHVKNALVISMHKTGRRGLFSLTQQKNDHSCKEETIDLFIFGNLFTGVS